MKRQNQTSYRKNINFFSAFLTLFLFSTPVFSQEEVKKDITVSPLTLISYGQIFACGIQVSTSSLYEEITAEVKVQHKNGTNIFSVRVGYQEPRKNTNLLDLSLKTSSVDSKVYFPKASFDEDGLLSLKAPLGDSTGATFIQELLVLGAEFSITKKDGKILSFALPKPISHSIRQAYLSCAGDLIGSNE